MESYSLALSSIDYRIVAVGGSMVVVVA